jgi:hypothetical protein
MSYHALPVAVGTDLPGIGKVDGKAVADETPVAQPARVLIG